MLLALRVRVGLRVRGRVRGRVRVGDKGRVRVRVRVGDKGRLRVRVGVAVGHLLAHVEHLVQRGGAPAGVITR